MRQEVVPRYQSPLAATTQGGSRQQGGVQLGLGSSPSRDPAPIVRSKEQQHGAILTGGLPMGFLTVWAVVYVDVWGLLLFHSNTAETKEKQTSLTSSQLTPQELPQQRSAAPPTHFSRGRAG